MILLSATADSAYQFLIWDFLIALVGGSAAALGLSTLEATGLPARRGHGRGLCFGSIVGGIALGPVGAVNIEPLVGWQWLIIGVGALGLLQSLRLIGDRESEPERSARPSEFSPVVTDKRPMKMPSALFFILNGGVHAGLLSWLGVYFSERIGLANGGVSVALVCYGLSALLFGPQFGRLAESISRNRLVSLGTGLATLSIWFLCLPLSSNAAYLFVVLLACSFNMTQPQIWARIVGPNVTPTAEYAGRTIGLFFLGLGVGSLLFGALLHTSGFQAALASYGLVEGLLFLFSLWVHHSDTALRRKGRPLVMSPFLSPN